MGMTFYEGKGKLKSGDAIIFPRQNRVAGLPVLKKDGTPLPNDTYEFEDGTFFTVKDGKIANLKAEKPAPVIVEEVKPKEDAKKPEEQPVIDTEKKPEEKPAAEEKPPVEPVVTPVV